MTLISQPTGISIRTCKRTIKGSFAGFSRRCCTLVWHKKKEIVGDFVRLLGEILRQTEAANEISVYVSQVPGLFEYFYIKQ